MKLDTREFEEKMKKSVNSYADNLSTIRAGRANPDVLKKINADYYGSPTPISTIAEIKVADARTIVITAWDKSAMKEIEKAILTSDLGINPQNDGSCIRLSFPPMTEERRKELSKRISQQIDELERISGYSRDEAREVLLEKLKNEVKNESGLLVRSILEEARERSEKEARRILTYAMQRYASDCTYERTTATIPLPSDEMKGRIIGREGRNIRAIESATGVNLLIDDTPEAVVISCFDPVRKEVARRLMERLIGDGRIHPTRVEDLVKKISKELEDELFQVGEAAVLETGIPGVSPQVMKLLGRLKYRYSFSQNVLQHSLETAYFMGVIAAELGLDEKKAKRIGLFHDLGKAIDHEVEGPHAQIGADVLRKYNEPKDVVHAVAAHHAEIEPESLYDILINTCDTLSASRPGARSETTELYLKRLEQLEAIANEFNGVESCFALQAGREIRVVVTPEKIGEGDAQMLAKDICARIEKEMTYPGQIKVTIIRETRSVEYAK